MFIELVKYLKSHRNEIKLCENPEKKIEIMERQIANRLNGMHKYSKTSLKRLQTCHEDLQRLFKRVLQTYDNTVIEGHRNKVKQNNFYHAGKSTLKYPDSKHNQSPSMAVDVMPYFSKRLHKKIVDSGMWEKQLYHFAGYVKAMADDMGIKIRCGADWNNNNAIGDQTFHDVVHFELEV